MGHGGPTGWHVSLVWHAAPVQFIGGGGPGHFCSLDLQCTGQPMSFGMHISFGIGGMGGTPGGGGGYGGISGAGHFFISGVQYTGHGVDKDWHVSLV